MKHITELILILLFLMIAFTCYLFAPADLKLTGNIPGEIINLFTAAKKELMKIPLINEERANKIIEEATFARTNVGDYKDMWDDKKDKIMIFTKALVGKWEDTPSPDIDIIEFLLKRSGIKFYTVAPDYWQKHQAQYEWQMLPARMAMVASGKGVLLIFLPQGGTILVDTGLAKPEETLFFIKEVFRVLGYISPFIKNRIDWIILTQNGNNTKENLSAICKKNRVRQIVVLSSQEQKKQELYDLVASVYGKKQAPVSYIHPGDNMDLLQDNANIRLIAGGGGFILEFDKVILLYNTSLTSLSKKETKKFIHIISDQDLFKMPGLIFYTDGVLTFKERS